MELAKQFERFFITGFYGSSKIGKPPKVDSFFVEGDVSHPLPIPSAPTNTLVTRAVVSAEGGITVIKCSGGGAEIASLAVKPVSISMVNIDLSVGNSENKAMQIPSLSIPDSVVIGASVDSSVFVYLRRPFDA